MVQIDFGQFLTMNEGTMDQSLKHRIHNSKSSISMILIGEHLQLGNQKQLDILLKYED